ncbi:uncharacterized protein VTP21DRAFT_3558 [Calcarisporiella thermophila]|uniref:uncharacterized protein n=1 Tax=Calcarisporiella thermophila TaxID=911321 RepID=UPI0037432771
MAGLPAFSENFSILLRSGLHSVPRRKLCFKSLSDRRNGKIETPALALASYVTSVGAMIFYLNLLILLLLLLSVALEMEGNSSERYSSRSS